MEFMKTDRNKKIKKPLNVNEFIKEINHQDPKEEDLFQ